MELLLGIVGLIIAIGAVGFVIAFAIEFIRGVRAEHDYGFFNLALLAIFGSFLTILVSMFGSGDETVMNTIILGLLVLALALNIKNLGVIKGLFFSILQFAAVYAAILVWIAYAVFSGIRGARS